MGKSIYLWPTQKNRRIHVTPSEMENYYGFWGSSRVINHSVWRRRSEICLNRAMSLRRITQNYLSMTIEIYFMYWAEFLSFFPAGTFPDMQMSLAIEISRRRQFASCYCASLYRDAD